jgi:Leucine rich repeat
LIASVTSTDVDCNFRDALWTDETLTTCFGTDIEENPNDETLSLNNTESLPPGKTEENVEAIYMQDFNITNFPFFTNLPWIKAMTWTSCEITFLRSSHFRGLNNLKHVNFPNNKLTRLPGRLFRHTPNLRFVNFGGNKQLKHIGFNLFKSLRFLLEINFGGSECAPGSSTTNSDLLTALTAQFMKDCPPHPEDNEKDLEAMECDFNPDLDKSSRKGSKGN